MADSKPPENEFCASTSESDNDSPEDTVLGRSIKIEQALLLFEKLKQRKTIKIHACKHRRRQKRKKAPSEGKPILEGITNFNRGRFEEEFEASDTFSEIKSTSSMGTSTIFGQQK